MLYRDIIASISQDLEGMPQKVLDKAAAGITLSDQNLIVSLCPISLQKTRD